MATYSGKPILSIILYEWLVVFFKSITKLLQSWIAADHVVRMAASLSPNFAVILQMRCANSCALPRYSAGVKASSCALASSGMVNC